MQEVLPSGFVMLLWPGTRMMDVLLLYGLDLSEGITQD